MEINTFNEKFNELWKESLSQNHENNKIKSTINELIIEAKEKDSLIMIGHNHPYEPHKVIPNSYDGEKEYIIMHNEKLLLYKDPTIEYVEGKVQLSMHRIIVWPATVTQWLLSGTDNQIDFVRKYRTDIFG